MRGKEQSLKPGANVSKKLKEALNGDGEEMVRDRKAKGENEAKQGGFPK